MFFLLYVSCNGPKKMVLFVLVDSSSMRRTWLFMFQKKGFVVE